MFKIPLKMKINATDNDMIEIFTTNSRNKNLVWALVHSDILFEGKSDISHNILCVLQKGETLSFDLVKE